MLNTKDGRLIDIKELTWLDVVDEIEPINLNLAKAMENLLDKSYDYVFYKASYQFGSKIIGNNMCYLPLNNGDSIAFNDELLPNSLLSDLSYNHNTEAPLGIIVNKTSEFYLSTKARIQPHSIINPGQMFGIPRAIDNNSINSLIPASNLNLNAGARSIFMLSSISDKFHHNKLQEYYGTKLSAPASLEEHWSIFVDIAKRSNSQWRCEIIYFPRKWINQLKTSDWASLAICLIQLHRASYNIWHNLALLWNNVFLNIEQEKKLINYPMNSLAIAKQMFTIAGNSALGFKPAINDNLAPISLLKNAYAQIYKMSQNPVFMEPDKFNILNSEALYYSVNYPTFIQNNPNASKKKSHIALLEEVMRICEIYRNAILTNGYNIESLYNVVKKTEFSYYHSNSQDYKNIVNAGLIPNTDSRFITELNNEFPKNSQFFKGCIKIARKY